MRVLGNPTKTFVTTGRYAPEGERIYGAGLCADVLFFRRGFKHTAVRPVSAAEARVLLRDSAKHAERYPGLHRRRAYYLMITHTPTGDPDFARCLMEVPRVLWRAFADKAAQGIDCPEETAEALLDRLNGDRIRWQERVTAEVQRAGIAA